MLGSVFFDILKNLTNKILALFREILPLLTTMSKLNSKMFKHKMSEMKGPTDNGENMQNVVQYASVRVKNTILMNFLFNIS